MNTLLDVKKTVRSLVGDDDAEWTVDDYLLPKINFAYRTQYLFLKKATGSNLEQIVEIPNAADANGNSITQGLMSFANFQQPEGLLEGLYQPLYLWWKPAGSQPRLYQELFERKTLPFTVPQVYSSMQRLYFTWRGSVLYMTPSQGPIDILVDGRFNPPPLVKDEDVLIVHPDMDSAVIPATLGLIGLESGNTGWGSAAVEMVEENAQNIADIIILGKQGYTARAGSNSRVNRRGWGWSGAW